MRAERENSDAVDDSVCADDGSVNVDENRARATNEARSRLEAMHACELGQRCPQFLMALNRYSLHHTAASTGGTSRGDMKGKHTFNCWHLPDANIASHPVLKSLGLELAKFAYAFLSQVLNIP